MNVSKCNYISCYMSKFQISLPVGDLFEKPTKLTNAIRITKNGQQTIAKNRLKNSILQSRYIILNVSIILIELDQVKH